MASLDEVLADHDEFREAVAINKRVFTKRMEQHLTRSKDQEPLLCTHVSCKIASNDRRAILYAPRTNFGGSVVCHLGEVDLGRSAKGEILSVLEIDE